MAPGGRRAHPLRGALVRRDCWPRRRKRTAFVGVYGRGPTKKPENTVRKQSFGNKYFLNSLVNVIKTFDNKHRALQLI